ncbi:redoxin domain-containing protein [Paenibacillus sp. KQZ6P-2]|uniref:thioredoxin-dependent peroxiredoxin n=1 Tax=Paenibacillus mangrovi TaxID=2931978 RepID=A0A9X1WUD4_9BACL|nr:redoxin domain-containing protein [Paenibacillus mangrovi]MCJ8012034.1 redoxin domain-containing protein [Paenibacillus mangrovi]
MSDQLQHGDTAPLFQMKDQNDKPILLENNRGRKVLLAFFRNSACALCNLRVHQFIQRHQAWQQQGMEVIAFFESPEANLHKYVGQQNAPFPLIADPEAEIYDVYGAETSEAKVQATLSLPGIQEKISVQVEEAGFKLIPEEGSNFNRIPAEFLIDEKGIIQVAYYGRLITDHLPYETIERFSAGN